MACVAAESATHNSTISVDVVESNKAINPYCNKTVVIYDYLNKFDYVLYLDCDVIVRGSLDGIWDNISLNTLMIHYNENSKNYGKFNTGIMLLGRGLIEMVREWKDISLRSKLKDSYPEQKILYKLYERNIKTVNLVSLDEKYNDCRFLKNSIIWHYKGKHKHNYHEPWKTEYDHIWDIIIRKNRADNE
jgi:lipopolysaccharide biosynthesis glycosyltransferase